MLTNTNRRPGVPGAAPRGHEKGAGQRDGPGADGDAMAAVDWLHTGARRTRGGRSPGRPGIRRTWFSVLGVLLVVLLATGGGAFALMRSQRATFDRTTSQFQRELGVLAMLQHELIEAEVPVGGILYELDRAGSLDEQWSHWESHRRSIDQHFETLGQLMHGSNRDRLEEAATAWVRVVDGVGDARAVWGTGEVSASLARGDDPFDATVWTSLGTTKSALAASAVASVERLRIESAGSAEQHATIEKLLAAVLLAALALCALSGRRLSRRVIRPLRELGGEMARLRDGDLRSFVGCSQHAGLEVAELAAALSDMARTLDGDQLRLRGQANTDALTGLANRRAFVDALDLATATGLDHRTAVLLIDIDDFKWVNDSLGHAAGDEMLVAIAARLAAATQFHDTVARLGGDEFAVIVVGDDALGSASALAERVLCSMGHPVSILGQLIMVSCSIGGADGSATATTEELVRQADRAMYVAKGRGKACFEVYEPTHQAEGPVNPAGAQMPIAVMQAGSPAAREASVTGVDSP